MTGICIHSIAADVGVSDETAKRWLGVLEKSYIKMGLGAVICTKQTLTALDRNAVIVPVWCL